MITLWLKKILRKQLFGPMPQPTGEQKQEVGVTKWTPLKEGIEEMWLKVKDYLSVGNEKELMEKVEATVKERVPTILSQDYEGSPSRKLEEEGETSFPVATWTEEEGAGQLLVTIEKTEKGEYKGTVSYRQLDKDENETYRKTVGTFVWVPAPKGGTETHGGQGPTVF